MEQNETYVASLPMKEVSFEDMESGLLKDGGIAEVPAAKKKAATAARLRTFMFGGTGEYRGNAYPNNQISAICL